MTQMILNLPDEFAERAQTAGLLNEQTIVRLIDAELRRRTAGERLLVKMQRLRKDDQPPLTEEEIAAEIAAVRAAKRKTHEDRC